MCVCVFWELQLNICAELTPPHPVTGLDKIEFLQSHENLEIYQKAFEIIEHYFGGEEEDSKVAPSVDESGHQFQFNPEAGAPPQGGFNF